MDNSPAITTPPTTEPCYACNTMISTDDIYCTGCGYPLKGTDFEKNTFLARRDNLQLDLGEFNRKLKRAGNSLFYIAFFFVIGLLYYIATNKTNPDTLTGIIITYLILIVVFIALGFFSRKIPLAGIVSGLCLYVIVQVINAIASPVSLFSGIIVKILIIGYLVNGIKSAVEIERFKKEHNLS